MKKFMVLSLASFLCFGCIIAEDAANESYLVEVQTEDWQTFHMKYSQAEVLFLSVDMPSSAIPLFMPNEKRLYGFHAGSNPSYLIMLSNEIDGFWNENFSSLLNDYIEGIKECWDAEFISSMDTVTSQGFPAHDLVFLLPDGHPYRYRKYRLIALPNNDMYALCTFSADGQDQHQRFVDSFQADALSAFEK